MITLRDANTLVADAQTRLLVVLAEVDLDRAMRRMAASWLPLFMASVRIEFINV